MTAIVFMTKIEGGMNKMSLWKEIIGAETFFWITVAIFAITYIGMLAFGKIRPYIALGGAGLILLFGALSIPEALREINWNILMMLAGTMGTVALFIESKMPAKMADWIITKSPNLKWVVIWLSVFAGVVSAFVDNVATVLMIAPIAVTIAKKLKISPVPSVIAISIASNLQGAATLVGDTTSILLGGAANMNFLDFFFFKPEGRSTYGIGMFWIVQVAFLAATAILFFTFRKEKQPISLEEKTEVTDYLPSVLLVGTILSLILVSFLPNEMHFASWIFHKPENINGILCVVFYAIGVIYYLLRRKIKMVKASVHELDWRTLLLLMGLFIVIGGLVKVGAVTRLGEQFSKLSGSPFIIYTCLVWFSVIVSAVVDNIPYTATMLPVVAALSTAMNMPPYLFYFGLLSGATLGGNLTPIGASANIAALGILRKDGYTVKAGTFMKISVPYTLTAAVVGYVLVWLCWK